MGNYLIKSAQRKRSNKNGANKNRRKQTQRNGNNSNGMPIESPSNENQHLLSSSIFKLNCHCFDELFEYLSLIDLHSLGQTCKTMQQMTGEFFTRNYSAAKVTCLRDGIYLIDTDARIEDSIDKCVPIPGFIQFITSIAIEDNIVAGWREENVYRYYCSPSKFEYIKLHSDEFKLVKKLSITDALLDKEIVGYILKMLSNIEVLELSHCTVNQDLFDILLKYCKNVRCIQLSRLKFNSNIRFNWLMQQYEKLEHLELGLEDIFEEILLIDELCTFFELNPNIRSFACDSLTLLSNKDAFLKSKVKLDIFQLKCYGDDYMFNKKPILDLLHQLHTHGFYERLHKNEFTNRLYAELPPITFLLENFCICGAECSIGSLSTNLKCETEEVSLCHWKSENEILVENLMNVEHLYLSRLHLNILLFIKKLRNLKKMKLVKFKSAEILELDMLNTEREKLDGARKVTIYVPDTVFLATKWATKNGITNFSMIEMKRINSYEWNRSVYCWTMPQLFLPPLMK